MMINSTNALVDVVKQLPGFVHLLPKLQRLSTCVIQKLTMAAKYDPSAFNVINHGDLWSNNVMFTHDPVTVSPLDAIIVDFQCGYFNSPVLDIMQVLFNSSSKTLRANDWDEIVIHYHSELVNLLRKLEYSKPVPTLSEIQAERRKRIHYSAPMGVFALSVRNVTQDADISMFFGQSEEDHNYRVQALLTPKYRKNLEFLLQFCEDNGLLEV